MIREALKDWEEAEIIKSLPGAGNILTAQLLGEIGSIDRFESSDALALYCSLAPIPHSSGKWQTDKNTKRVNRVAKDALMQLAQCSKKYNPISTQYYQKKRDEGKSHWHALKCLARNLVRVIYAMLRDGTYYQPHHGGKKEDEKSQARKQEPAIAAA